MKTGIELIKDINTYEGNHGEAAFWWIGQISFVVKFGSTVVYFDPFLSEHSKRRVPSFLKPSEVTNADFIFGSHDHIDHIDRSTWNEISKSSPGAKFIVPIKFVEELSRSLNIEKERFIGMNDGMSVFLKGLEISAIPSAHELLDFDKETASYPYLGFVVTGNGVTVYHSGDTCIYEGIQDKLRKWETLDIMFVPINGRDGRRLRSNLIGNMTFQEAVDLAGTLKPGLVVPAHYEMFAANSEDPELFRDYLDIKYKDIKCWIGEHGERVIFKK
jgi:L-ascorbate 6-phosphate lactonase